MKKIIGLCILTFFSSLSLIGQPQKESEQNLKNEYRCYQGNDIVKLFEEKRYFNDCNLDSLPSMIFYDKEILYIENELIRNSEQLNSEEIVKSIFFDENPQKITDEFRFLLFETQRINSTGISPLIFHEEGIWLKIYIGEDGMVKNIEKVITKGCSSLNMSKIIWNLYRTVWKPGEFKNKEVNSVLNYLIIVKRREDIISK